MQSTTKSNSVPLPHKTQTIPELWSNTNSCTDCTAVDSVVLLRTLYENGEITLLSEDEEDARDGEKRRGRAKERPNN
jgi:hypothetical protein